MYDRLDLDVPVKGPVQVRLASNVASGLRVGDDGEPRPGRTLGLVVNPFAGMGGGVGLKGTDGPEILAEARRRGARPRSGERAVRALTRLAASAARFTLLTGSGEMGEDAARVAGLEPSIRAVATQQRHCDIRRPQ